jgi:hypothetical protein
MKSKNEITTLKRYTTLAVLQDLLERKKMTLLDPKLWEDKNDAEIIDEYKKKKNIKKLFAICFSHGDETIHHWNTFAKGFNGCRIDFDAQKLFEHIEQLKDLRIKHQEVIYKRLPFSGEINTDDIPFTKKWPYRCEEEYRIIVEDIDDSKDLFEIDIPLDIINRITINQNMPEQIFETIKNYLKDIVGGSQRVYRSTLFENKIWIDKFQKTEK